MKKCILYCFSGTGNTNRVCKMLLSELSSYEYEGEIFDITYDAYKRKACPDPNDYDLIGVAYPGHAFNAPRLFNRFVKLFPKAKREQRAFIIKCSGEPFSVNNSSSNAVKRYFRRKGYQVTYEKHYLMPYNIMFRYPPGLAKQMYLYSQQMAKVSAKKIASSEREFLHGNPFSAIMCFLGKIEWFGAWFNGLFYKVNDRKCTDCGMCAKNCPAQNITKKNGRYHFGIHCTLCCRCTMHCPKDAISMGLLNCLRVNGAYEFEKLAEDEAVSGNYVNERTVGYYKKFHPYYTKIDRELISCGLVPPRSLFAPDEYAVMSKKQRKALKRQRKIAEKKRTGKSR